MGYTMGVFVGLFFSLPVGFYSVVVGIGLFPSRPGAAREVDPDLGWRAPRFPPPAPLGHLLELSGQGAGRPPHPPLVSLGCARALGSSRRALRGAGALPCKVTW